MKHGLTNCEETPTLLKELQLESIAVKYFYTLSFDWLRLCR